MTVEAWSFGQPTHKIDPYRSRAHNRTDFPVTVL